MSKFTAQKLSGIPTTLNQVSITSGHELRVEGILNLVGTGALQLPSGTTGQRPGSPQIGYTRWNTDDTKVETWNGSEWVQL